jgi:hypothetical protein
MSGESARKRKAAFALPQVILAILMSLATATAADPAERPNQPSSERRPQNRRSGFWKAITGPATLARVGAGVVFEEIRNSPHEWGRGLGGVAKRAGSLMGANVVRQAVQRPVAHALHEDLRYYPSGKTGFGPRLRYALISTVVARKTTTGGKTAAAGRIAGAFSSGMVSRVWQPARLRTVGSGFASGGIALGIDAGTNVVREFWPEIRHPHRSKATARRAKAR